MLNGDSWSSVSFNGVWWWWMPKHQKYRGEIYLKKLCFDPYRSYEICRLNIPWLVLDTHTHIGRTCGLVWSTPSVGSSDNWENPPVVALFFPADYKHWCVTSRHKSPPGSSTPRIYQCSSTPMGSLKTWWSLDLFHVSICFQFVSTEDIGTSFFKCSGERGGDRPSLPFPWEAVRLASDFNFWLLDGFRMWMD